jgi:Ser/Thr protein kinase RdoA (MazF antagonist)
MAYRDLSNDEQVEALRPVARAAAERFGLDAVRVELAAHAFNTTFRVDTADGGRFALRVGTNSHSTRENVVAQQAWQCAIASDTEVLVAQPLAATDGAWWVEVEDTGFDSPVMVTAASWLAGPDVAQPDVTVARELGRTMALLHRHAESWRIPAGAELPRFDTPLFGDVDLLGTAPGLSPVDRDVLDRARSRTSSTFAELYDGAPVRPLHADLHGGNLKWHGGRLAVFDFDDCGLGIPALDLAIATFYLRGEDPALEVALADGYAEVAPRPVVDPDHLEAMIAARQLLLANSLLDSSTAELRQEAVGYLSVTVDRLRHWLSTGRFTRSLPT